MRNNKKIIMILFRSPARWRGTARTNLCVNVALLLSARLTNQFLNVWQEWTPNFIRLPLIEWKLRS